LSSNPTDPPRQLAVSVIARKLNVPARTIRYWIKKGWLAAERRGLRSWSCAWSDATKVAQRLGRVWL
jgi:hypothetical protein